MINWLQKWKAGLCSTSRCAAELEIPLWLMMEYAKVYDFAKWSKDRHPEIVHRYLDYCKVQE